MEEITDLSAAEESVAHTEEEPRGDHHLEETSFGAKESYEWGKATITLALTIHPEDGNENGRPITMVARTHNDAPLVRMTRHKAMGNMPMPITEILRELENAMPEKERAAIERDQQEEQKKSKEASDAKERAAKAKHSGKAAKASVAAHQKSPSAGQKQAAAHKEHQGMLFDEPTQNDTANEEVAKK